MRVGRDGWRGGEAAHTAKVVTRLVSQPLISLLKLEQPLKREDKSVTCEIFHKPIGPYVAFAAAGLAHQAYTAVCRAALLAKTLFWPAAGETPPNSTRSATPLATADGIDRCAPRDISALLGVRLKEKLDKLSDIATSTEIGD